MKNSLGVFQNAIPIRGNTNIDRKSHHLFGQRMIVLANHTSPSVDLPTEKKYSHREIVLSLPVKTGPKYPKAVNFEELPGSFSKCSFSQQEHKYSLREHRPHDKCSRSTHGCSVSGTPSVGHVAATRVTPQQQVAA